MNKTARDVLLKCYGHYREFPEVTQHDLTLYVSPTGSDLCGKGTLALPYATVERAEWDIADLIAHKVQIRILGSLTTPERWGSFKRHTFVNGGSLQIFGIAAPVVKTVHGGPHAVTAIGSIGNTMQKVTIGAGGLVAKEFKGYWVRVATGGHVGRAFRVVDNDTSNIWINVDPSGDVVHNGDTVEIIRPALTVALDGWDLNYESCADGYDAVTYGTSLMVVSNLCLDISGASDGMFKAHGNMADADGPNLDFVLLLSGPGQTVLCDIAINQSPPVVTDYIAASLAAIANSGEYATGPGLMIAGAGDVAEVLIFSSGRVWLGAVSATGRITVTSAATAFAFMGSAARILVGYGRTTIIAAINGAGAGEAAVELENSGHDYIDVNVLGACNYAIKTGTGSVPVVGASASCDPALTTLSGVYIGSAAQVLMSGACTGLYGATAGQKAYICKGDPAVKADTFGAAGGYVTDAKGASLLRVA